MITEEQWDSLTVIDESLITIDDLTDKSDRLLIFAKHKRDHYYQYTFIEDGIIYTKVREFKYDDIDDVYELLSAFDIKVFHNAAYVDHLMLCLNYCDYEFVKLLFERVDSYRIDGCFDTMNVKDFIE